MTKLLALAVLAVCPVFAGAAETAKDCELIPVSTRARALARWSRERALFELANESWLSAKRAYRSRAVEKANEDLLSGSDPLGHLRRLQDAFAGVDSDPLVVEALAKSVDANRRSMEAARETFEEDEEVYRRVWASGLTGAQLNVAYSDVDGSDYSRLGLIKGQDYKVGRCDPRFVSGF